MAVKEFIIGPQSYWEEGYFSGDYTESNVSRSFLECDIDNIKGGRVVTGEYYEDNYIDGTYYHNNSMAFQMSVEAMIVQDAVISATNYYDGDYYESGYYGDSGSKFTLFIKLGETVGATGTLSAEFAQSSVIGKLQLAEIAAVTLFTPSIGANITVNPFATIETEIDLSLTASKFTGYESLQEFFAALNAQNDRQRLFDSALAATTAAQTDAARLRDTQTSLAVSFDTNADVNAIPDVSATIEVTSTLTANLTELALIESTLFNAVTINAIPTTYVRKPNYGRPNELIYYVLSGTNRIQTAPTVNEYTASPVQGSYAWDYPAVFGPHLLATFPSINAGTSNWHFSFYYARQDQNINRDNERFIARLGSANSSVVTSALGNYLNYRSDDFLAVTLVRTTDSGFPTIRLRLSNGSTIEGGSFNSGRITVQRVGNTVTLYVDGASRGTATLTGNMVSVSQVEFQPHETPNSLVIPLLDDAIFKIGTVSATDAVQENDEFTVFHHTFEQTLADNRVFTGNAVLTSASAQSAAITVDYRPTLALSAQTTLQATAVETDDFRAELTAQVTLTSNSGKLLETSVDIDALFTPSVNANALNPGEMQVTVISTVSAAAQRLRSSGSRTLSSQTALSALGRYGVRGGNATLSSNFALNATTKIIENKEYPGSYRALYHFDNNFDDSISNLNKQVFGTINANGFGGNYSTGLLNGYIELNRDGVQVGDTRLPGSVGLPQETRTPIWSVDFKIKSLSSLPTTNTNMEITLFSGQGVTIGIRRNQDYPGIDGNVWQWFFGDEYYSPLIGKATLDNDLFTGNGVHVEFYCYDYASFINDPDYTPNFIIKVNGVGVAGGPLFVRNSTTPTLKYIGPRVTSGSPGVDWIIDEVRLQTYDYWAASLNAPYEKVVFNGYLGVDVNSSMTTIPDVIVEQQASISSTTIATISGRRIRFGNSVQSSTASLNCNITRIRSQQSNLQTSASMSVNAVKTARVISNQTSALSLSANNIRVKYNSSSTQSQFDATINAVKNIGTISNLESSITQVTNGARIRFGVPQLEAVASALAATSAIANFFVNCEVFANLTANASKIIDDSYALQSAASVNANTNFIASFNSSIESSSSLSAISEKLKITESIIDAKVTQTADAVKTAAFESQVSTAFASVTQPFRIRFNTVALNIQAQQFAEFAVLFDGESTMAAEFTGVFALGRVRRLEEDLRVEGFILTVGDVINIDPIRQLIVPAETRVFVIDEETLEIIVPSETRIIMI